MSEEKVEIGIYLEALLTKQQLKKEKNEAVVKLAKRSCRNRR